jgi:hypothetical protein
MAKGKHITDLNRLEIEYALKQMKEWILSLEY